MDDPAIIIARACEALTANDDAEAFAIIERDYPFAPVTVTKRTYKPVDALALFVRDGFIDRYSGARLIFPPVLHVLHHKNPDLFPQHPAWKTDATHPAFNQLTATVDHVVPVTLGGEDGPRNWVTTSMARNFAKNNFTLAELGWGLHAAGDIGVWDGLASWFVDYCGQDGTVLTRSAVKKWYAPAQKMVASGWRLAEGFAPVELT